MSVPEVDVHLRRTGIKGSADQPLWTAIRLSTQRISFKNYGRFMDILMCGDTSPGDEGFPLSRARSRWEPF